MKKFIITLFVLIAVSVSSFAQNVVVVERPGVLTDLSTALIGVPCAAASGLVQGICEAGRNLVSGTTTVVTTPAPKQVVVTSPAVVVPSTTVTTTTTAPVYVGPGTVVQYPSTTQITTIYGNGTSVTVTRPASGYELGPNVVYPVAPGHRVGPSPLVNPYIRRPHGF